MNTDKQHILYFHLDFFFVLLNAIYRGNKTLAQNRRLLFSCKFGQTVCQNCSAFHYCEIFIAQWWYTVTLKVVCHDNDSRQTVAKYSHNRRHVPLPCRNHKKNTWEISASKITREIANIRLQLYAYSYILVYRGKSIIFDYFFVCIM